MTRTPAGATALGAGTPEWHATAERRPASAPRTAPRPAATGVRANGVWCGLLLSAGDVGVLLLAGLLGWSPGIALAIALGVVAVGVALLAGRGGLFEAAILPGTVAVVVSSVLIAVEPAALGGGLAAAGTVRRVWDVIGQIAPAAGTAWACAVVTLVLRRAGILRRL